MMGSNVSRIGTDGAKCPAMRLRPLLLQHLATMRTWRLPVPLRPAKDTPSKKGLLLDNKESSRVAMAPGPVIGDPYGFNVSIKPNLIRVNCKNHDANKLHADHEVDGEDDDEGRRIAAGPGSPSFRIFFEDAAKCSRDDKNVNLGQNEAAKETDSRCDVALSKETSVQKRMKRERKMKRHIKTVMSGTRREAANAVKNLLNVKPCYNPSRRSTSLPATAAKKTSF